MAKKSNGIAAKQSKAVKANGSGPRSAKYAEAGVRTAEDFANVMSALMGDILTGRVTPQVGNATCTAGAKLLRIVEMQYKYGKGTSKAPARAMILSSVEK